MDPPPSLARRATSATAPRPAASTSVTRLRSQATRSPPGATFKGDSASDAFNDSKPHVLTTSSPCRRDTHVWFGCRIALTRSSSNAPAPASTRAPTRSCSRTRTRRSPSPLRHARSRRRLPLEQGLRNSRFLQQWDRSGRSPGMWCSTWWPPQLEAAFIAALATEDAGPADRTQPMLRLGRTGSSGA